MKKISKNLTTYAMWAFLIGLAMATGPAVGFGQDTNDLANQVTTEPATEAVEEVASKPAAEPLTETAAEPANETVDGPANGAASENARQPAVESDIGRSAYSLITQRNMFSQDRAPIPEIERRATRQEARTPAPSEESYYILCGIVRENDTFIAFIQDNRQGGVLRLRAGDKVARGTIGSLTLDTLKYEFGEKMTEVAIGHDLDGGAGALNLNDMSTWSSSSYPSSTSYSSTTRRNRNNTAGRGGDRMGNTRFGNGGFGDYGFGGSRITSTPSNTATADEPLTGDAAELARRLMERRQQQLGD